MSIIHNQPNFTRITNPGAIVEAISSGFSRVLYFNNNNGETNVLPDGTAGQFLRTDGAGVLSWVTGGGGGAVDIDGLTDGFTSANTVVLGNTLTPANTNTTILSRTLATIGSGNNNTILGAITLPSIVSAANNTIVGVANYLNLNGANNNVLIGVGTGTSLTLGIGNIGIGSNNNVGTSATNNIIIGTGSGTGIAGGFDNIFIGRNITTSTPGLQRAIVFGTGITPNISDGIFFPPTTASIAASRLVLFNSTSGQLGPNNTTVNQIIAADNAMINITSIIQIIEFNTSHIGITLQAGTYNGQLAIIAIEPSSTGTLTLDATPATSRVAGSNNASVGVYDADGTTSQVFTYIWSAASSLWIPTVN